MAVDLVLDDPASLAELALGALGVARVLAPLAAADVAEIGRQMEVVTIPPGAFVVREGERERDMFFILRGEARITRARLEIGVTGPGACFGELGLIAGRPRAASVAAVTPLVLAKLTRARYEALAAASPGVALRLTQSIVATVGLELTDMTDKVGVLLDERSLPRRTHVRVRIGERELDVHMGTPLQALLPAEEGGALVAAALLNHKAVTLRHRITADAEVAALTTAHWEGQRIYRRSLGLLLLEAAHRLDPSRPVRLGPSLGVGQAVDIDGVAGDDRASFGARIEAEMRAVAAANPPFSHEWWAVEEAAAFFQERGWLHAVELIRTTREGAVRLVTCGEVYALGMDPLLASAGPLKGFWITPRDHGLLLHYGDVPSPEEGFRALDERTVMAREHALWLDSMGVSSVGDFNNACISGDVSQLIRVAEGFHEKRIGEIADAIVARGACARVICLAGPSSSGKTTFIKRLTTQLQVNGIRPISLSLDDYYLDRAVTPRTADGDYDYEALEALDLPLLSEHLRCLLSGEPARTPRYDFVSGHRTFGDGETRLGEHEVLLVEGIHGLNPALFGAAAAPDQTYRIFVQPTASLPFDRLNRLNSSDVRLIRRIVRDRHTRGKSAAETILRWPAVRAGERAHIFPFLANADAVFDSALVYELSVLKVYAERYLLEIPQQHETYVTAHRLRRLIDQYVAIHPDHVAPTSIVREFIGGSGFEG